MRLRKLLSIAITVIICFTSVFVSACTVRPEELGVPHAQKFPNGEVASCLWDLYVLDQKIYLGGGDYDLNQGPTDVYAYDLKLKQFVLTGTVNDEAVVSFMQIGDKLVATGTDPMEDWTVGNYYTLTEQGWEKQRVLPNAVHNFDLVEYKGKIYAGIGGNYGHYPVLVSTDGGKTFMEIPLYKEGKELPTLLEPDYSRCYDFYIFNDKLYALVCFFVDDGYKFEIFRLDDGKMQYVANANELSFANRSNVKIVGAKAEINGKLYLVTSYLYTSTDGITFEKRELPSNAYACDFLVEDGKMYILGYNLNEDYTYDVLVFYLDLVSGEMRTCSCFNYPVSPLSFVKVGKYLYIGMGNKTAQHEKNGMLLRIRA